MEGREGVKYIMDKKKLYVGNLPWSVTNDSLRELFAPCGEVTEAIVITDKYSGRSKGFGFVTFANDADAEKAITEMANKDLEGRKIVVNVAKPREERPRTNDRRDFRQGY